MIVKRSRMTYCVLCSRYFGIAKIKDGRIGNDYGSTINVVGGRDTEISTNIGLQRSPFC